MTTNTECSMTLVAPGDILSTNAEELRTRFFADLKRLDGSLRRVDLDLSRAVMVDSVGLNLVVSVIKHVKGRHGSVRFLIGNKNVERMFRFTRLDSQAEVVRVGHRSA